jgi:archaemetzincin
VPGAGPTLGDSPATTFSCHSPPDGVYFRNEDGPDRQAAEKTVHRDAFHLLQRLYPPLPQCRRDRLCRLVPEVRPEGRGAPVPDRDQRPFLYGGLIAEDGTVSLLKAKLVVIPMGEVDFALVNKLAVALGPVFNHSVDILKGMKMPEESYNVVRNQYYAQVVLTKIERTKANSREKVIAICEEDLYLPDENHVMGHSDRVSGTAIVSLYHLRQEFYGLPEDESKVYPRLYKESVHRLAHLLGLSECRNPKCVNYFSQSMLDIDSKPPTLCDICLRQLTGLT